MNHRSYKSNTKPIQACPSFIICFIFKICEIRIHKPHENNPSGTNVSHNKKDIFYDNHFLSFTTHVIINASIFAQCAELYNYSLRTTNQFTLQYSYLLSCSRLYFPKFHNHTKPISKLQHKSSLPLLFLSTFLLQVSQLFQLSEQSSFSAY